MDWNTLCNDPAFVGGQVEVQNFPLILRGTISSITIEGKFVVVKKEWTAQYVKSEWILYDNADLKIPAEKNLSSFGEGRMGIIIPNTPITWAITFYPKTYHKFLNFEQVKQS